MAGYRAAVKEESLIMHNYLKLQEKILTAACQQKQRLEKICIYAMPRKKM